MLINFAHRTFKWSNDAKGVAAVYCVIIGFALQVETERSDYSITQISKANQLRNVAQNINPYLVDAPQYS